MIFNFLFYIFLKFLNFSRKGDTHMAVLYASLVYYGYMKFDAVIEFLKPQVREILTVWEYKFPTAEQ